MTKYILSIDDLISKRDDLLNQIIKDSKSYNKKCIFKQWSELFNGKCDFKSKINEIWIILFDINYFSKIKSKILLNTNNKNNCSSDTNSDTIGIPINISEIVIIHTDNY